MAAPQTDPQYKLRLPADLKDRIEAAAQAANRSMNAEIVARLQHSIDNSDFFDNKLFTLDARKHLDRSGLVLAHHAIEELLNYLGFKPRMLPRHIAEQLESVAFMRNMVAHGPGAAERMRAETEDRYFGAPSRTLEPDSERVQNVIAKLKALIDNDRRRRPAENTEATEEDTMEVGSAGPSGEPPGSETGEPEEPAAGPPMRRRGRLIDLG